MKNEYPIDTEAIRHDVYRRFRKYIWFGLHFLSIIAFFTLDVVFFDALDNMNSFLSPLTFIALLTWLFIHTPYLIFLNLRERAVQKAIERERNAYIHARQTQYTDESRLYDDGELSETNDDYFYVEKSKNFSQN